MFIDRALLQILNEMNDGDAMHWMARQLRNDGTGGRAQDSIVMVSNEGQINVVLDLIDGRRCRLYEGFIGRGWRLSNDRLWTDEWPIGHAVGLSLVGRKIESLIDFEPISQRRITGLLGGSRPYGVIFEKDLVEIVLPGLE